MVSLGAASLPTRRRIPQQKTVRYQDPQLSSQKIYDPASRSLGGIHENSSCTTIWSAHPTQWMTRRSIKTSQKNLTPILISCLNLKKEMSLPSLSNLNSFISSNILKVVEFSLDPPNIKKNNSKGIVEIKSIQNRHYCMQLIAIADGLNSSNPVFKLTYVVLKFIMMSNKKKTSMKQPTTVIPKLSALLSHAIQIGTYIQLKSTRMMMQRSHHILYLEE